MSSNPSFRNDYTLSGPSAAAWLWSQLWQPDQGSGSHAKARLLDGITVENQGHGDSSSGAIAGWIFTSVSDGYVKSKARAGWSSDGVLRRCLTAANSSSSSNSSSGGEPRVLKAHIGTANTSTNNAASSIVWKEVEEARLPAAVQMGGAVLVLLAPLTGTHSYLEVTYECDPSPLAAPKVTSSTLYQGSTLIEENHLKGLNYQHSRNTEKVDPDGRKDVVIPPIPPHRAPCLSKPLLTLARAYAVDLAKQVEARGHLRIARLVLVLILETLPGPTQSGDESSKVLWLHHCRDAAFNFHSPHTNTNTNTNANTNFERASNTGSDLSYSVGGRARAGGSGKCSGDFCSFEDELAGGRGVSVLDEGGDLRTEAKKARRRHRADDEVSAQLAREAEAMEEEARRAAAAEDTPPGPSQAGPSSKNNASNGASNSNNNNNPAVNVNAPGTVLANQVPFKSILLARSEAATWEGQGLPYDRTVTYWPEPLYQWWIRVGKAYAKRGGGALPAASAYTTFRSLTGARTSSAEGRERDTTSNIHSHSNVHSNANVKVRKHSLSSLAFTDSASEHETSARDGNSVSVGGDSDSGTNSILYDLAENAYTHSHVTSMGQASWYYSRAGVCDRCYAVYRDLDRRRTGTQQLLLKRQREAAQKGQNEALVGREIERRIFEQRRFASRMSRALLKGEDPGQPSFRHSLRSHDGPGDPYSLANSNANSNCCGAHPPSTNASVNARVLPPLPWQLRDAGKGQEYQEGSFQRGFTKHIRTKAQQMAALVQQDRQLERAREHRGGARLGGMLDADSVAGGDSQTLSLAPDFDWRAVTGMDEKERQRQREEAERANARRVTGGLGENRPKPKSKNFDPERLMHGWQRDMEQWREKLKDEHEQHTGLAGPSDAGQQRLHKKAEKAKRSSNTNANTNYNTSYNAALSIDAGGYANTNTDFGGSAYDGGLNSLQQGSLVSQISQLTMDGPSVYGYSNANTNTNTSLSELDDDEWIRKIIGGKPQAINLNANAKSKSVSFGASTAAASSKVNTDFQLSLSNGAATVSRVGGNSNGGGNNSNAANSNADSDDEEDEEEEGGIGWSPFVIPMA